MVIDFCEVVVCAGDPLSQTFNVTVNDPGDPYAWVVVDPVPVEPSPKSQVSEYGCVPPDTVAVNVTCCPVWGEDGL